ncbi:MAG: hypothetical protein F4X35_01730 [Alphaproteobacteria bacterium]|nr:hypothetical protein [Alphaproteobacteria bacterium]
MNDLWFRILLFVFSLRCYVLLAALGLGFLFGLVMLSIPGALVSDAVTRFFFGGPAPEEARWPAAIAVSWAAPWCIPLLYWSRRAIRRWPRPAQWAFRIAAALVWTVAVALIAEAWRRW